MRSKVVSAMRAAAAPARSRPLSALVLPGRREARVARSAPRLSAVAPNAPNHDSSATVGRRAGRGRVGAAASARGRAHRRAPRDRPPREAGSAVRIADRRLMARGLRLLERRRDARRRRRRRRGRAAPRRAAGARRTARRRPSPAAPSAAARGAPAAPRAARSARRAAARAGRTTATRNRTELHAAHAAGGRCSTTSSTKREPT